MTNITTSKDYFVTLQSIKQKVKSAQIRAHLAVNKEMLILYWQIGKIIAQQRKVQKWGSKVIDQLARDLRSEFVKMKGLSTTNLKYMAIYFESYPDLLSENNSLIGQQAADQLENSYFINDKLGIFLNIPWFHNVEIFSKIQDPKQRIWYARKTVEYGWSRSMLVIQIDSDLYSRQAIKEIKSNNFKLTMPAVESDLANDIFKDEYNLEFVDNGQTPFKERQLEDALMNDVIKFLTELGKGFALVGKQYHLEFEDEDLYIDLLFYHLELRCFIVIDLKTTKFKAEYAGKMALYLSEVDENLKKESDANSIGVILCPSSKSGKAEKVVNYTKSHL